MILAHQSLSTRLCLLLSCVLLPSCGFIATSGINISTSGKGSKRAWGLYDPQRTYVLQKAVFVMKQATGLDGPRLALVPGEMDFPCARFYSSPTSVAAYRKDPAAASTIEMKSSNGKPWTYSVLKDVAGIMERGTHLVPARISHQRGFTIWFGVHNGSTLFGRVTDGQFAGQEVDLSDVSYFIGRSNTPIPEFLVPASN